MSLVPDFREMSWLDFFMNIVILLKIGRLTMNFVAERAPVSQCFPVTNYRQLDKYQTIKFELNKHPVASVVPKTARLTETNVYCISIFHIPRYLTPGVGVQ